MHIAYVTQWFEPEPNVIKGIRFVEALAAAGHQVTVITAFPNYPGGRIFDGYRLRLIHREMIGSVAVVRLPLYPSHDRSALRRSLTFLSFFLSAFAYLTLRRRRFDLAYVYHPPITVGLAAALARIPFVLDVQDLWPDTIEVTGLRGASRLARLLGRCCRYVYRRAAAILAQSDGIRRALIDRGVPEAKVEVVRNWAVAEFDGLGARRRRPGPFTLVYGGNLGRAQQLGNLISAAGILRQERPAIQIHLYGSGIDEEELREAARRQQLDNLDFRGRIAAVEIAEIFRNADALLLHLADDPLFAITIPSKTQQYLAAGRPILGAVDGETARILKESGAALVVPPANPGALARAIVELADAPSEQHDAMGRAGADYYARHFSFRVATRRTIALLEDTYASVVGRQGSR